MRELPIAHHPFLHILPISCFVFSALLQGYRDFLRTFFPIFIVYFAPSTFTSYKLLSSLFLIVLITHVNRIKPLPTSLIVISLSFLSHRLGFLKNLFCSISVCMTSPPMLCAMMKPSMSAVTKRSGGEYRGPGTPLTSFLTNAGFNR